MINKNDFLRQMQHAVGDDGKIEASNVDAFKLDDEDGIACHLGFNTSMLPKVDYFIENNHIIKFIELSDLEDQINKCNLEMASAAGKTASEARKIRKKAWEPLTSEFKRKWCGSIATIERLYRKNQIIEVNPQYQLLIVCRNKTDPRILESLRSQLQGMMGSVKITNTKNIEQLVP